MNTKNVLISQFHAALKMLRHTLQQCPEALWDNPQDQNRFWHVAYHTLFYTHFYLHPSADEFHPWTGFREGYNYMGQKPAPAGEQPQIDEPYSKADLLEFLEVVWQAVPELIGKVDLESENSGFHWLPFGKLELQIYTLRHLQQHTGELMERLGRLVTLEVAWVGAV
jgi:hypothetical protein